MDPNPPLEVPTVNAPGGKARRVIVAGVLVAAALGVAFWLRVQQHQREMAAAHEIGALGALVVMDTGGSHVSSVNLSTIPTPESLAKAVDQLSALRYVTALDASRTTLGDEHLAAISQLSGLNSLTLNETKVTDAGVARLGGLRNLQALYLVNTGVSDDCAAALAKIPDLHILDLSATRVTDNLEPLAGLPKLEWLLLRETTLKDSALPKLASSGSLGRVSLEGSAYAAASLAKLQKSSPSLTVDVTVAEPTP